MEAPPSGTPDMDEDSLDSEEGRQLAGRFGSSQPLEALDEALKRPEAHADLMAMLSHRLGGKPTPQTWGEVADAFGNYLGARDSTAVEPADVLALVAIDPPSNLPIVDQLLADRPNALGFIRRAVASYGPEILAAYEGFAESPDDWRAIQPRVFHDLTREQPHIELRIEKYGGEQVFLEGSPTSILKLTRSLIRALAAVPTLESFEPDAAGSFVEVAGSLVERLKEQLEGPGENQDSAAPAGHEAATPGAP